MRGVGQFIIALGLLLGLINPAMAHTRSQSASDWQINGNRLEVSFSINSRRATLLYGLEGMENSPLPEALATHLRETVSVSQQGVACTLIQSPQVLASTEGYERAGFSFECPQAIDETSTTIVIGSFFGLSATHLHIIRVQNGDELAIERVLTGGENRVEIGSSRSSFARLASFLKAGVSHVLSGWDHLAFLAALLLLAGRARPMILTITGFTLGHSLTMALVALGLLSPHALAIEVLIGFSIAYAAMETGFKETADRSRQVLWVLVAVFGAGLGLLALGMGAAWPAIAALMGGSVFVFSQSVTPRVKTIWRAPFLAALFGLAHGAGFAGALLEFDLEGAGLLWALLGFNLGVEAGQLIAVGAILGAAFGFKLATQVEIRSLAMPSAAILFGLGVFWTVSRLIPSL